MTAGMLLLAIPAALGVARSVESAELRTIAVESATRHAVEAPAPAGPVETAGGHQAMLMPLRGGPAAPGGTATASDPLRSGQHTRIWVDEDGNRTPPPRTEIDARTSGIAAGLMMWLSLASSAGVGLKVLGRFLDRSRYRAWDRDLQLLVNGGGGSTAHNS
jgi:hypothetical protein